MVPLAVMVAAAENDVIGSNNGLPWHLPADLRHFKRTTLGKPVVMGRKTFESIGRPLPGRANIVISRDPGYPAQGVRLVASLDAALRLAGQVAELDGAAEAVVIGGAAIYALALPRADRLYLTRIHATVVGDTLLPPIDWRQWREISRERHPAGDGNDHDYSFLVYARVGGGATGADNRVLPPLAD